MPIIRDFIYKEDEETGLSGLVPVWMPNGNSTTQVAHDVLEHVLPGDHTPIEDELMALGAVLALRIENDALTRYRSHADQLAILVANVIQDVERYDLPLPRRCPSRGLGEEYAWAEDLISQGATKGIEIARKEMDYDKTFEEEEAAVFADIPALRANIVGYLRKGYRKAVRRYANRDLYTVGQVLFKRLNEASEKLVSSEMLEVGDRVRVLVDVRRCDVSFKVNGVDSEMYL